MRLIAASILSFSLLFAASVLLAQVEENGQSKTQTRQQSKVKKTKRRESCYQLGYRYGKCFTLGMAGLRCDPKDDISIPPECRNNEQKDRGLKAGVEEIYRKYGLR